MSNFYQNWIIDKINANLQTKMFAKALDEHSAHLDNMIEILQKINNDIQQIKAGGLQQVRIGKVRKGEPKIVEPTGYKEDVVVPFVPDVDTSGLIMTTKNNKQIKKTSKDLTKMAEKLSEEN